MGFRFAQHAAGFSGCGVVEKQILAQILITALAVEALETGGRICGDHPLAGMKSPNVLAHGHDIASQLVPK